MIKIYNTFTKQKEEFIPMEDDIIKMYVCGQTVYDYCHLGHARKELVFDVIRRWFISSGYKVTFVENITDIDDKIINKAIANNEDFITLTNRYINYMHEDFNKLGIMPPDIEPRATEYIPQMIAIIETLINKNFAYKASNGDVYYAVDKFNNYGLLSGKKLHELNAGNRVAIDEFKRNPLDFVLWKSVKDNTHEANSNKSNNHEPFWPSAILGNGRPGWHIECSAMSQSLLGSHFDIHGGGLDLQFPHHENEIAQSEAANGCKFANYWLHNGFLNISDEKMSKSTGNFYTLREILAKYDEELIKFFILKTHYQSPLNFSFDILDNTKQSLLKLYFAIKDFNINLDNYQINWDNYFANKFKQAMDDNFNTPLSIVVLFELVSKINQDKDINDALLLVALANTINLLIKPAKQFLQQQKNNFDSSNNSENINVVEIKLLITKRLAAKKNKNYQLADQIRKQLLDKNIILEDNINNTTSWHIHN